MRQKEKRNPPCHYQKNPKYPHHPLLKHCLLLNPVKWYDELFVSIPKEFPLKTLQLSCKIFISNLWKARFSEGHHNLHSPRALQSSCSRKRGQGSMELEPAKAKQSLERNSKPTIPLVHMCFSLQVESPARRL